ncbi:Transportin-3 [Trichinella pseudospiralis]|uniref:Transportin-3 n=2 Tax=Trichinella pseudospiralis TaxID=6337 RepID=A0A0V1K6V0_TRIPS|nr:Transportin-3 [Trichinella pseudospiralis]
MRHWISLSSIAFIILLKFCFCISILSMYLSHCQLNICEEEYLEIIEICQGKLHSCPDKEALYVACMKKCFMNYNSEEEINILDAVNRSLAEFMEKSCSRSIYSPSRPHAISTYKITILILPSSNVKFLLRATTLMQELSRSYFKHVDSQMAAFTAANSLWQLCLARSWLFVATIVEMDVDSLFTNVICAVRTMLTGTNVEEIHNATNWLNEFQKSDMAVVIAEKILNSNNLPAAWLFAATTIRTKLLNNFQQASSDSYSMFLDSLVSLAMRFNAIGNRPVLSTLSSAIAILHIKVHDWKDPVLDLSSKLVTPGNQHLLFLLVLSTYTEELNNERLRVGICRRQELKQAVYLQMNNIMECVTSICAMDGPENERLAAQQCALKCLSNLIGAIFPPNEICQYPLFGKILEILEDKWADATIHECALECASNFLLEIADLQYQSSFTIQPYKHIILKLFELQPMLFTAVAEKDDQRIQNYVKLFIELSESCITTMITEADPDIDKKPLTLMLEIFALNDYQLIGKTFSFWYLLSEAIYKMSDHCNIEKEVFKYVSELMNVCCYEEDTHDIPSEEDEFEDFRFMARESIRDVTFIIGSVTLLKKIYKRLTNCGNDWRKIEACFYVLSSVSSIAPLEHFEQIGEVFKSITVMPTETHPCLVRAALDFVICSYTWLHCNPDYFDATFTFVLSCFKNQKLHNQAAKAVMCLSDQKRAVMFLDDLINILKNAFQSQAPAKIVNRLIEAFMNILMMSPPNQLESILTELMSDQIKRLAEVMRVASSDNSIPRQAVNYLDSISVFFRSAKFEVRSNSRHPFLPVTTELCPFLLQILDVAVADYNITEHCCRSLRYMFRCLERNALIYTMYQKTGFSCYMYLASVLTDQFGDNPEFRPGLQHLFNSLIPISFQELCKKNFSEECYDTLDDFFRLTYRYFSNFPDTFASVELQDVMMKVIVATSRINSDFSFRSMCGFVRVLFEFVSDGISAEQFKNRKEEDLKIINAYVMKIGFELVFTFLKAAVTHICHSVNEAVGEIMLVIATYNRDMYMSWIKQSIQCFANENAQLAPLLENIGTKLAQVTEITDYFNLVTSLADLYR